MLNRKELAYTSGSADSLLAELDGVTKQLDASNARNARWRAVIERHLERGCPSNSLRALLAESDSIPDEWN
jgi:hypothetical protein